MNVTTHEKNKTKKSWKKVTKTSFCLDCHVQQLSRPSTKRTLFNGSFAAAIGSPDFVVQ